MVIKLNSELESAVNQAAKQKGVAPEELVIDLLSQQFLRSIKRLEPRDEWERKLLSAGSDCGVSLSNEALSSEGLYD